jgi:hypothetical protein
MTSRNADLSWVALGKLSDLLEKHVVLGVRGGAGKGGNSRNRRSTAPEDSSTFRRASADDVRRMQDLVEQHPEVRDPRNALRFMKLPRTRTIPEDVVRHYADNIPEHWILEQREHDILLINGKNLFVVYNYNSQTHKIDVMFGNLLYYNPTCTFQSLDQFDKAVQTGCLRMILEARNSRDPLTITKEFRDEFQKFTDHSIEIDDCDFYITFNYEDHKLMVYQFEDGGYSVASGIKPENVFVMFQYTNTENRVFAFESVEEFFAGFGNRNIHQELQWNSSPVY